MSVLELKNICKSFGDQKVIDDVSFKIESGKIIGLLGRNGSGKTTILKMINDLLVPTSGEILVCGEKVGEKTKAMISFLPEKSYLDTNQNIFEVFKFFKDFYPDFDYLKAEKLLKDLNLKLDMNLAKMSKGMKEKLQLILVMSRNAKLYILDEPLGGVDPTTRDYIIQTILSNFAEGSSLLITTHLIADIEKILDEVIFIDKGKIILNENADELRENRQASINEIFRREVK